MRRYNRVMLVVTLVAIVFLPLAANATAPILKDIPDIRQQIDPSGSTASVLDLDDYVVDPDNRDAASGAQDPLTWTAPGAVNASVGAMNELDAAVPAQGSSASEDVTLDANDGTDSRQTDIVVKSTNLLSAPLVQNYYGGYSPSSPGIAYSWCIEGVTITSGTEDLGGGGTTWIDFLPAFPTGDGGRMFLVFSSGAGETCIYNPSSILTGPAINGPLNPSGNRPAFKGGHLGTDGAVFNGAAATFDANLCLSVDARFDGMFVSALDCFSDWVRVSVGRNWLDGGYDHYTVCLADFLNGTNANLIGNAIGASSDSSVGSNYGFEGISVLDFLGAADSATYNGLSGGFAVRDARAAQTTNWTIGSAGQLPNDLNGTTVPDITLVTGQPAATYPGATNGQALCLTFNQTGHQTIFMSHKGITEDQYSPGDVITTSFDMYLDAGYDGANDDLINESTAGIAIAFGIFTFPGGMANTVNYVNFPISQAGAAPLRKGGNPAEPFGRGGSQEVSLSSVLHGKWSRHCVSMRIPETGQQLTGDASTQDIVDPVGINVAVLFGRTDGVAGVPDQVIYVDNVCITRCPGCIALSTADSRVKMISSGFVDQFNNGADSGPGGRFVTGYGDVPLPASLARGQEIFGSASQGSDGTATATPPSTYLAGTPAVFGDATDVSNAGWLEALTPGDDSLFLATGGNAIALNYPTLGAGNRSLGLTPALSGNSPPSEPGSAHPGVAQLNSPWIDMLLVHQNTIPGLCVQDVTFGGGTGGAIGGLDGDLNPNSILNNVSGCFGARWFVASNATDTSHNPALVSIMVNADFTMGLVSVRFAPTLPSADNANYSGDVWIDDFHEGSFITFNSNRKAYDIILNNQAGGRFHGEVPAPSLNGLTTDNPGNQLALINIQRVPDAGAVGGILASQGVTSPFAGGEPVSGAHSTATLYVDEINLYAAHDSGAVYDEDISPGGLTLPF